MIHPFEGRYFNTGFTGLQTVSGTTRHLPDLTRHAHPAYSVIEEIVEGFVEGFWDGANSFQPILTNQTAISMD
jgi:hypothetical protein